MKKLPNFTALGFLPEGVHRCNMAQLKAVFGTTPPRERLIGQLEQGIALMKQHNLKGVILLDGSFVTDKEAPNDIDLTLDVRSCKKPEQEAALLFTYYHKAELKGLDLDFYSTLPHDSDFTKFFQYAGTKAAAVKQCDPQLKKGIVRLTPW